MYIFRGKCSRMKLEQSIPNHIEMHTQKGKYLDTFTQGYRHSKPHILIFLFFLLTNVNCQAIM